MWNRDKQWQSVVALLAERADEGRRDQRAGRLLGYCKQRVRAVRAGYVEADAEAHAELWPAMGVAVFPGPGDSTGTDGVWAVSERPQVSIRRLPSEPEEAVSTQARIRLGSDRQWHLCA